MIKDKKTVHKQYTLVGKFVFPRGRYIHNSEPASSVYCRWTVSKRDGGWLESDVSMLGRVSYK